MSDVVAVALITGLSTAAAGLLGGIFAVVRERIRSAGETERQARQLGAEQQRDRAEVVREGRQQFAERLRNFIENQVLLAGDMSALIGVQPTVSATVPVKELIDKQFVVLDAIPAEELSINTVLSHCSDPSIIEAGRGILALAVENRQFVLSPNFQAEFQAANDSGDIAQMHGVWKPFVERGETIDKKIAELNRLLETYVIASDLP